MIYIVAEHATCLITRFTFSRRKRRRCIFFWLFFPEGGAKLAKTNAPKLKNLNHGIRNTLEEGRGRERVKSLAPRRESGKLFPANVRPSKQRMP